MGHMNPVEFTAARDMEDLYRLLAGAGMGPGWNKPEPSLWPAPRGTMLPAHWPYALAKPALDAAGRYVSTELAERRNLVLFNPAPGNAYATTRTMVSAYQMVLPGETARSHRHSPNALRLVVDARPGACTIVDGERIPMLPGDVLLTPNWSWHGHRNDSAERAYWIDFLDVPMVHFLEPMFFESFPEGIEQAGADAAASPMRFAFDAIRRGLDAQSPAEPGRRELVLGPAQLDTMALIVWRLDPGARCTVRRSTASSIFAVIDGGGRSRIGDKAFEWRHGDVFVAPAWSRHECEATEPSHLLRVSDEPVLRKLGWLRQD